MSSSRKYPYFPHRRPEGIWNFLGVGGSEEQNLKECMKLNRHFQRGRAVFEKIPSVWDVWIFSGTTQLWGRFRSSEKLRQLFALTADRI